MLCELTRKASHAATEIKRSPALFRKTKLQCLRPERLDFAFSGGKELIQAQIRLAGKDCPDRFFCKLVPIVDVILKFHPQSMWSLNGALHAVNRKLCNFIQWFKTSRSWDVSKRVIRSTRFILRVAFSEI